MKQIFECQRCGYCCQGKTTVSLDEEDRRRMVQALGLSEDEVRDKYWRVTGNVTQMKIVDGHCIFYNNGCTVHTGRPWRCGQWPLHPSLLTDENNFTTIKESCPGMNQRISYEEFCRILQSIMAAQGIIKC
ncbi:MAG: YkgJ family cysteine cluster protein [Pseudomonadota bacterium]